MRTLDLLPGPSSPPEVILGLGDWKSSVKTVPNIPGQACFGPTSPKSQLHCQDFISTQWGLIIHKDLECLHLHGTRLQNGSWTFKNTGLGECNQLGGANTIMSWYGFVMLVQSQFAQLPVCEDPSVKAKCDKNELSAILVSGARASLELTFQKELSYT